MLKVSNSEKIIYVHDLEENPVIRVNVTDAHPIVESRAAEEGGPRADLKQNAVMDQHAKDGPGPVPLEELEKEDLINKAKELQLASEKNYDLYLRAQAEMENMKKRFQREKGEWAKFANESLIKDLLPTVDSLEKATAHAQSEASSQSLMEGVGLTLKGLKEILARSGVEEIKALGQKFDPNFHEAISQQENDLAEDGTVLIEVQKGFLLHGRLIRPSMVVVSKKR